MASCKFRVLKLYIYCTLNDCINIVIYSFVITVDSLSFADDSDMRVVSIGSDTSNTKNIPKWAPIAEESVVRALEILMNTANYPILITCKHGRAITGTVVGCLRKMQRWSLTSIFEEYRRYARTRLEQQHERFIE